MTRVLTDPTVCQICGRAGCTDHDASGVTFDHFYAYMPMHAYIYTPTREIWPASSVNARLEPVPLLAADGTPKLTKNGDPLFLHPSTWLDQNRPVEQMTWIPGHPMLIRDQFVADGGWIAQPGTACFNLYRPPRIRPGQASQATRWLEHVAYVYPDDPDHIVAWLAHRVQRPDEKINHALVLGGLQGIGKDTLLEPVKAAIGPWNFVDVSPSHLLGRFNGFVKSVILRISEARRRSLQFLRPTQGLHRRAARRPSCRREKPARIRRLEHLRRRHHHELQGQPVPAAR
jgi:hypothetical protein